MQVTSRRPWHVAVLLCAASELASASCVTVHGAADAGAPTDDAQAESSSDAVPIVADSFTSDASTCEWKPPNIPAGIPGWPTNIVPPPRRRSDCDPQLVEYLVRCDFGDPTLNAGTCAQRRTESWWQPCADCLYGQEGVTTLDSGLEFPTPFVLHKGAARLNVAACIAFARGDWTLNGCIGDWYGDERCRSFACEDCVDKGPDAFANCWTRAASPGGPCPPRIKGECALEAVDAGCGVGTDFIAAARAYARAFCANDGG